MRHTRTSSMITGFGLALWMGVALGSVGSAQDFFDPAAELERTDPNTVASVNRVPDYTEQPTVNARFPRPTRSFSLFRSLVTYGSAPWERCMPEMFSPRGVGIARRTGRDRMDYSPYVVTHPISNHGPSYYKWLHLAPCCQPHHCERRGLKFGWQVYY